MMEPKPEGDLIDLWDTPLTAVHDPDHLKRIKGWMVFTGPSDADAEALQTAIAVEDAPRHPRHDVGYDLTRFYDNR